MNDFRLIFLLSIILFTTSCKEDDASPDKYTGEASALKNGQEWVAQSFLDQVTDSTHIFRGNVYNNQGFRRECFDIRHFRSVFHKQQIVTVDRLNEFGLISTDYNTVLDDGDVLGDIYKLDKTASNNFIQITNYSSSKAEVEGVFNVTMILSRASNDGGTPPEKLEFTNGKFRVKVKREWFE